MQVLEKIRTNIVGMLPQRTSKSHVGLDIGSSAIKLLESSTTDHGKPTLNKIGIRELPLNLTEQILINELKALLETVHLGSNEVNISVCGSNVAVRFVEFPLMQESEFSQALPYEAEKHIPFDIKDTILDYVILEKAYSQNRMKALLIGVKNDFVRERIRIVSAAGLKANIIDVDAFALFNIFIQNIAKDEIKEKTVALLNVGSSITTVIILYHALPWMVRDVSVGCNDVINTLRDKLRLDIEKARDLVYNPKTMNDEASSIVSGVFNKLLDEIKLSFSYYENKYGRGVDDIYISGGGTKLSGLQPFFSNATNTQIKLWNPFGHFRINNSVSSELLEKHRHSFAVCCGLALRKR